MMEWLSENWWIALFGIPVVFLIIRAWRDDRDVTQSEQGALEWQKKRRLEQDEKRDLEFEKRQREKKEKDDEALAICVKFGTWIVNEGAPKMRKGEIPDYETLPYPKGVIEAAAERVLKHDGYESKEALTASLAMLYRGTEYLGGNSSNENETVEGKDSGDDPELKEYITRDGKTVYTSKSGALEIETLEEEDAEETDSNEDDDVEEDEVEEHWLDKRFREQDEKRIDHLESENEMLKEEIKKLKEDK